MTKHPSDSSPSSDRFSRRSFFKGSSAVAAASAVGAAAPGANAQDVAPVVSGPQKISLHINGSPRSVEVEPRTTLLEVLRYDLNLTGAKPVSGDGSSGASTVLIDGRPVMASTTLALTAVDKKITTVEGLGGDSADPTVAAFVEYDAEQCGFCTPGFVVAVRAFLNKNPNASEDDIRKGLNGNICRCGTYANVLQAAVSVVKRGIHG